MTPKTMVRLGVVAALALLAVSLMVQVASAAPLPPVLTLMSQSKKF